jgi:hypothetical protein
MRSETRVNLIFLTVFVAISLPGAVILVRKKLQPGAPRMDQPDPIVTRLPYMTPLPAPPDVKWIVPDRTRAWLEEITREQNGSSRILSAAPPGPRWQPVISPVHLLQLMAITDKESSKKVSVLLWNGQIEPSASRYTVKIDGAPGRVIGVHEFIIPAQVRQELVRLDYGRPPERLIWLDAELTGTGMKQSTTAVTVDYDGPPVPLHSSLKAGAMN